MAYIMDQNAKMTYIIAVYLSRYLINFGQIVIVKRENYATMADFGYFMFQR